MASSSPPSAARAAIVSSRVRTSAAKSAARAEVGTVGHRCRSRAGRGGAAGGGRRCEATARAEAASLALDRSKFCLGDQQVEQVEHQELAVLGRQVVGLQELLVAPR